MAVTATGDALALGVLLGLAAVDVVAGGIGVLVGLAVAGRWGSTALSALAGGQAVVGPAAWSGSAAMVASSWAAALALVLACGRGWPRRSGHAGLETIAFGSAAALVLAGPAAGRSPTAALGLRVVATVAAVVACRAASRRLPRETARTAGGVAAALAVALAFAS
jgi:hypothetical protein